MKKIILATILIGGLFIVQSTVATPTNLVVNGDFEVPEVTNSSKWQIFPSNEVPGWTVEWAGTYPGAPAIANLELHEGVLMPAYSGDQSVEMDTDWSSANGEKASVKIYQDIETCVGGKYTLSYAWSPRPGHGNNAMEVYWGGSLVGSHSGSTSGWNLETIPGLTAPGATTRIEFIETATPDSLGMFLDAVSIITECVPETEICDGLDNDCDCLIDEDLGTTTCGLGVCEHTIDNCVGGVPQTCDPYAGATTEICDSLDNDCDGLVDEGGVCDSDSDGIPDNEDLCSGTGADELSEGLGINRWIWNGNNWATGEIPGSGEGPQNDFTIEQTQGCSCFQILEWLHNNYPEEYGEMKGHWKFGCSISVMEEFIELISQ